MGKNTKTQSDNIFPPLEFGFQESSDPSSLYAALYYLHADRVEEFIDFLNIASKLIKKHARKVYDSTLAEYERQTKQAIPEEYEERLVRVMYWGTHEDFIFETIFVRLVERFLVYLTDVAEDVMGIQKQSNDELEKKPRKLINFNDLKQFYASNNFPLFTAKKEAADVEKIIAIRNLIVHRSGHVDDRFLSRFPSLKGIRGIKVVEEGLAVVHINRQTLKKYGLTLARVVARIDKRAIKKFHLVTVDDLLEMTPSDESTL